VEKQDTHQSEYEIETWTLTKADSAPLQAFHMKAQRRILNIKWYDLVTNDSVRSQTKLTDLPLIIADRHRRRKLLGRAGRGPPTFSPSWAAAMLGSPTFSHVKT